jgi:DNA-binding transcriptional MerR regulator
VTERQYRVREFASVGGVTVKALLHYDRLGLLVPTRSASDQRLYSTRDLERLRRILALKRIGVALTRMREVLDADPAALQARLQTTRDVIARERERLRLAERAIALVEESLDHAPDDTGGLDRLADVIDVQREAAGMRRYFSDDSWDPARRFYEDWPAEEWVRLYRDIAAAIPDGPETAHAEELLDRWNTLAQSLWRHLTSDRVISRQLHDGFARAWRDRQNWPDVIKRRFADYQMDEVAAFLGRVSIVVSNRRGCSSFVQRRDSATHVA